MRAFIDSREPEGMRNLAENKYGFETKELPQGDFYLPEKDVVIERKDASDFANSTSDGRLSNQADRMIAEHEHAYLIIENDLYWQNDEFNSLYSLIFSNVSANSLTGMQTSLAVKRGIKIIYTESGDQTLYAAKRIFERYMDDEHEQDGAGYVKTHDTGEVEDVQVAMLMQIDGISKEKADYIAESFDFSQLSENSYIYDSDDNRVKVEDALQSIPGIGPTLAERVISAFQ